MVSGETKSSGPKGTGFKQRAADLWTGLLRRLHADEKGGIHLAVAAVVTLVLSAALYVPLGLPAYWISRIAMLVPDGSCATNNAPGTFAYWACGAWLAITLTFGALVVILTLFLLRKQIRAGAKKGIALLPKELHFLERPVVVTLAFTMAWAGVQFHFFTRWGFIIDGLFPAFIGLLMFVLTFWEAPIKDGLGPVWRARERIPKIGRIVLVILVPVLLSYAFNAWMPFGLRDQLVALIAVFLGWVLWTASPATTPRVRKGPRTTTSVALLLLLSLALLLAVAVPVSAAFQCKKYQSPDTPLEFRICEAGHHNGTFGASGAVIGTGAAAVVLAPGRGEEEDAGDKPAKDVDPCADLQGAYDGLRAEWMGLNDFVQTQEKFIQAREEEYRIRNESTFWSQATDVAFMGAGLGGGGPLAGSAMGRVAQAAEGALKPIVVSEILKQAMVEGGTTNAMEVAYAVINKTSSGAAGKQHEQVLKQLHQVMVEDMGEKIAAMGIPKGSSQYVEAMAKWSADAENVTDMIGGIAKVGSGAVGLWNMYGQYKSLKEFSDKIHHLRLNLIEKQAELATLADRLKPAKYDLENCRERVAMGLDP